ncbi:Nuclear receptor-binding protein [Periplaneta americana]|uniref:Nuclear receptor-binding protein n=1 Tax=Periplaneta americana TaxID=6978 RepID=A0ABQ8SQI2_PERAM|nr:Nuclear receptor-binding protein [Periplaneta americana]
MEAATIWSRNRLMEGLNHDVEEEEEEEVFLQFNFHCVNCVEFEGHKSQLIILSSSSISYFIVQDRKVEQRDVPGIDCAYLAMDTEEGVEVVWNEVQFSERKNFKAQEEKIQQVFENLTQLEHPNIVKFHRYWTDTHNDKPRVIFITEYMSSGSLKQFLKRTKRNVKKLPLQAWKRWCTQILSALSYLHSCSPPIIHGNLTCDTIFIQHNGLVKIGSVAPDAIHHHVKTCRDNMKNMHFIAPEYGVIAITMQCYVFLLQWFTKGNDMAVKRTTASVHYS